MNEWLSDIQVGAKSVLHRLGHKVSFCEEQDGRGIHCTSLCSCCERKFAIYVSDMPNNYGDFAALLEVNQRQMSWHICDLEQELNPKDALSGMDPHYFCDRVKGFL